MDAAYDFLKRVASWSSGLLVALFTSKPVVAAETPSPVVVAVASSPASFSSSSSSRTVVVAPSTVAAAAAATATRAAPLPGTFQVYIPAGTIIHLSRAARMEDTEYGVHEFPGDASSIFFTTPTVFNLPANMDLAATPNPYEETPIRPRRSKRSQGKNAKTPAASLFKQLGNPSDFTYHVEGTLFENISPLKPTDFNMADFVNMSPEKQMLLKTPAAARQTKSHLNEITWTNIPQTPAPRFVFSTPNKGLKWGGNEENRHPNLLKTATKSFDPRVLLQNEDEEDEEEDNLHEELAPLTNVKARSKPFSAKTPGRSSKRQCSGEFTPATPRVPLQDLDSSQSRVSIASDNQSEGANEDDCLVLSTTPRDNRQASTAYRSFTAIDLKTLKSFSPAARVAEEEEPEIISPEEPQLVSTFIPESKKSQFTAEKSTPTVESNTPKSAQTPSRIPVGISRRRRGASEPPAPVSHLAQAESMISPATKRALNASYKALNAVERLEASRLTLSKRISPGDLAEPRSSSSSFRSIAASARSTLMAPTQSTSMKLKPPVGDEKKLHRRSASEPKDIQQAVVDYASQPIAAQPVAEPVDFMNLTDDDIEMLESEECKALPDSVVELKKLVLETQFQLRAEMKARKRVEETLDFMKVERDYYLQQSTKAAAMQATAVPAAPSTIRSTATTATSLPAPSSSRTPSSSTNESSRTHSSLSTRATRPPMQGPGVTRSTGTAQRPPSRGTNLTSSTTTSSRNTSTTASTSTRPASRSAGGISTSTSSRLNAIPARPNSALSRQPVRRK